MNILGLFYSILLKLVSTNLYLSVPLNTCPMFSIRLFGNAS